MRRTSKNYIIIYGIEWRTPLQWSHNAYNLGKLAVMLHELAPVTSFPGLKRFPEPLSVTF